MDRFAEYRRVAEADMDWLESRLRRLELAVGIFTTMMVVLAFVTFVGASGSLLAYGLTVGSKVLLGICVASTVAAFGGIGVLTWADRA